MSELIQITKLPGDENYKRPNYTVPTGATNGEIEQHLTNAIQFAKEFNIEVSFIDRDGNVKIDVCPNCGLGEAKGKYEEALRPSIEKEKEIMTEVTRNKNYNEREKTYTIPDGENTITHIQAAIEIAKQNQKGIFIDTKKMDAAIHIPQTAELEEVAKKFERFHRLEPGSLVKNIKTIISPTPEKEFPKR